MWGTALVFSDNDFVFSLHIVSEKQFISKYDSLHVRRYVGYGLLLPSAVTWQATRQPARTCLECRDKQNKPSMSYRNDYLIHLQISSPKTIGETTGRVEQC